MAECLDCSKANELHWWGGYRAGCDGCAARAIARSLSAFNAIDQNGDGEVQPLQDAIRRVLPEKCYDIARAEVWAWWKKDHQPRDKKDDTA